MKWEYREHRNYLDQEYLNMLGEEGWEMITCNVSDSQWRDAYYFYVFKRPLKQ